MKRVIVGAGVLGLWAAAACGPSDSTSVFDGGTTVDAGSGDDAPNIFDFDAQTFADTGRGDGGCGPNLAGLLRDFKGAAEPGGHPDFETIEGANAGLDPGIVQERIGVDKKPVFAGKTKSTTTQANFDQWFRDAPPVNKTKIVTLPFVVESTGRTTFDSAAFFPLDGDPDGFGNTPGRTHDYHFTYELHTQFLYQGGEVFNFRGDDDVWVFINGFRVVDLGGVHIAESATVDLDAEATRIGITKGQAYDFDFFFAERHTVESNFRLETTLKFVNCTPILPR